MFVIFKGKGILVPLFFILSIFINLILFVVVKKVFFHEYDSTVNPWILLGMVGVVAGIFTWFARDTFIVKDGKKIVLENVENTFFFVKMKYWAMLYWLGGLAMIIAGLIRT